MLKITDYHLLVLRGFDALKREIAEAEQFTIGQYNSAIEQQQRAQAESHQDAQPKTNVKKTTAVKGE